MVTDIVTAITSAFGAFLTGIGTSLVSLFEGLIIDAEGELTAFASWGLVFLGVSLAVGIFYAVFRKAGG